MSSSAVNVGTFCWNELATRDVASAQSFYGQLFGWQSRDQELPASGAPYKMVRLGDKDLAGMYDMAGPFFEGVPPHWVNYVLVESVDEVAARVEPAGGKLLLPPIDIPGVGRMAAFADPEGARLSLFQEGERKARPDLGATHGAFCWAELNTHDPDAAIAFYTTVLPWDGARTDTGQHPYTEWQAGGCSVGGMIRIDPDWGPIPAHWTSYFAVDDCDAAIARAVELGAKAMMPAMTIEGVGRFAALTDPTGDSFAVIKLDLPTT